MKNRTIRKGTFKERAQQKKQHLDQFKKDQQKFERQNCGRYEKIFPLPVEEAMKSNQAAQADKSLSQVQRQTAEMSYRALARQ